MVLVDKRSAMTPFWDDMNGLVRRLKRWRPEGGLEIVPLPHGISREWESLQPVRIQECLALKIPVLVLSDLGCLEPTHEMQAAWCQLGLRLKQKRSPGTALLPCPRDRWNPTAVRHWKCSTWDRGERPRVEGRSPLVREAGEKQALAVETLLDLLSSALFCDAAMLRELRLKLGGAKADVGTEFDVWFHPSQTERGGLAFALTAVAAVERRQKLARETHPLIHRLRDLLLRHHDFCAPTVRSKELLNLAQCRAEIPQSEIDEALVMQQRLAETALQAVVRTSPEDVRDQGLVDYFSRDVQRTSPDEIQNQPGLSIGYGVFRSFAGATVETLPPGVDEKLVRQAWERIVKNPGYDSLWELRQVGSGFRLQRWNPQADVGQVPALQTGAPLAWLLAGRPRFTVEVTSPKAPAIRYDVVLREEESMARFEAPEVTSMTIQSDRMRIELKAEEKPAWATRYGQDRFGRFAEFEIKGVRFPLRWIPPGGFLMGSPENENGRFEREGPRHQVTISRGYWLATTPCTQAQWTAVMGNQPSHFKQEGAPVESVSWLDCQEFCDRVGTIIRGLEFFLPTEAEWEYACRAGTDTAFNDGSDCTVPDGTDPALTKLGWHGEGSSGTTHSVGELVRNAWGLYDMHGNVWEWCQDGLRSYTADGVTNPLGSTEEDAGRALRGGSYWDDARDCRSAYRDGSDPGGRDGGFGFRLAAGQPGRSAALDLERGAEGRSPTGRSGRGAKAAGRMERPVWAASRWHTDEWGQLAEFSLGGVLFRFRWIPPGTFLMGSPEDEAGRWEDEVQHRVTLTRGFWMGETPCTQSQWEVVMGKNPSRFRRKDLPVEMVSWHDCQEFLGRLSGQVPSLYARLPSEAEWEYACRAGTTTAFNDGSDCTQPEGIDQALGALGWYSQNSGGKTHAVGEKRPNTWGLYDMHGNVLEWCHDGLRTFTPDEAIDPLGPLDQARRALRGGSCWNVARDCRSAYRFERVPVVRDDRIGFRLAAGQPVWSVAPDPESGAEGRSPTGGGERGAQDRRRPKVKR